MTAVTESMVFHAFVAKYTRIMVSCITPLVTQSETLGISFLFSFLKIRGNVPSLAAAYGICAIMIVNASQLVRSATITPRFMRMPPQEPCTTSCSRGAVEGFASPASSGWYIRPNGRIDSRA